MESAVLFSNFGFIGTLTPSTLAQTGDSSGLMVLIVGLVAIAIGIGLGLFFSGVLGGRKLQAAKAETEQLIKRGEDDARTAAEKIRLGAKRDA
ncbi:MAG: hypothetical protein JKY96_03445, partial [Phycisphaerales bacterium]|nr:hypothetical protein [Phycisphaerales bacterium]